VALLVAERAVQDRRRGFVGWSVGIAAYVALMVSVYPAVHDSEIQRAVRSYPKELKAFFGGAGAFDVSTGAGYLNVELYSLVVPALLAIVAIGYGAAALAGEQEAGRLDLLLAYPISRGRVVLEKIAALVATILALALVVAASIAVAGAFADLDIALGRVAAASLGSALVALFVGLVAMLAGAATGSRAFAIGTGTVLFAASYLLVGLAGLVSWIEPLRVLSPLYHANGTLPLRNGLPVANYSLLLALCLVTAGAVVVVFDRHDLTQ
jgi:ABC-2 type transport system permease protein